MANYKIEEGTDFLGGGIAIGESMQLEQIFDWSELIGAGVGYEARNRYKATSDGQEFFLAEEEGNCCERQCCPDARTTTVDVHAGEDESGPVLMKMHKPFMIPSLCACHSPCGPCGEPEIQIFPADVGDVSEGWDKRNLASVTFHTGCSESCFKTVNQTVRVKGEEKYTVHGSGCCSMPPCCDLELDISDVHSDEKVGEMVFHQQTLMECCKQTNRFDIEFPDEAGQADKAALMAAAFMADLWVEAQNRKKNDNQGGD